MRTFVGIRVGRDIQSALSRVADELQMLAPALRSPHPADMHVTVQFLGQTPDDDVHRVSRALTEVCGDLAPVPVRYVGLGAFPEPARARVVFAHVVEEPGHEGDLVSLAESIGARLDDLGYPPERRRFHPHVTLGRLRGRPQPELVERIEASGDEGYGAEILSVLNFILSDPGPRPYRYIDLTKIPLEGVGRDPA